LAGLSASRSIPTSTARKLRSPLVWTDALAPTDPRDGATDILSSQDPHGSSINIDDARRARPPPPRDLAPNHPSRSHIGRALRP